MEKLEPKKVFNPKGTDSISQRKMIGGNTTNLFNLSEVKYQWAQSMYRGMMENFWIPEKVSLSGEDKVYSEKLTNEERDAVDGIVSFLTFLDSVQTNNLPKIKDFITAPEVSTLIAIQEYQEAIHSQSYAYGIESIIPSNKRNKIYELWKKDEILLNRNKYIADIYQKFWDNPDLETFSDVLIANYILESLYFYNGFIFFYSLASRNKLVKFADIIRYIHRDESSHTHLFSNIIREIENENPGFIKEERVKELFREGVEQEITWTRHIIGDKILGIDADSTEQYTKFLANFRIAEIGIREPLYPDNVNTNPYAHLEKLSNLDEDGGAGSEVKSNFFEATVSAYNMSSAVPGWNKISSKYEENQEEDDVLEVEEVINEQI